MGLESPVTQISHLVETNPLGSDDRQYGDDHIRAIKVAVKSLLTNPQQIGLPTFSGNALEIVRVNAGATALETIPAGTGGGLDADTLDGSHASAFATAAALALVFGFKNIQTFTANGTWTRLTGSKSALVIGKGGGGGGATGISQMSGGGGGEGAIGIIFTDVSALASAAVAIGTGGATASVGGNTTFNGGTIAAGGAGASNVSGGAGGTTGVSGSNAIVLAGAAGQCGQAGASGILCGGAGGGGGGGVGQLPIGVTANAGVKGGGGAGGGYNFTGPVADTGGAGGAGWLIVVEFGV